MVIAALVICGSATPGSSRSPRARRSHSPGGCPARPPRRDRAPYSVAGYHYRIVVTPNLGAARRGGTRDRYIGRGRIGQRRRKRWQLSHRNECRVRRHRRRLLLDGTGRRGDTVDDFITGPQSAAVPMATAGSERHLTELPAGTGRGFLPAGRLTAADRRLAARTAGPLVDAVPGPHSGATRAHGRSSRRWRCFPSTRRSRDRHHSATRYPVSVVLADAQGDHPGDPRAALPRADSPRSDGSAGSPNTGCPSSPQPGDTRSRGSNG